MHYCNYIYKEFPTVIVNKPDIIIKLKLLLQFCELCHCFKVKTKRREKTNDKKKKF